MYIGYVQHSYVKLLPAERVWAEGSTADCHSYQKITVFVRVFGPADTSTALLILRTTEAADKWTTLRARMLTIAMK